MKGKWRNKRLLLLLMISWTSGFAQATLEEVGSFRPHFSAGIAISHAWLIQGQNGEGGVGIKTLPSWGMDINYMFHPKWAIGLHTDIITEKFFIEKSSGQNEGEQTVERSYPIAPALMGIFKATQHWSFLAGVGGEFAKEENFFLTRAGVEYCVEMKNNWEVVAAFNYDLKWDGYDDWVFGMGVVKAFGKSKEE